jgi:hypothetical protein
VIAPSHAGATASRLTWQLASRPAIEKFDPGRAPFVRIDEKKMVHNARRRLASFMKCRAERTQDVTFIAASMEEKRKDRERACWPDHGPGHCYINSGADSRRAGPDRNRRTT